jgi:hypothetical protein
VRVAATQQRDSCELVKIRCERGSSMVCKLGFCEAVAAGIYGEFTVLTSTGMAADYACIANLAQILEVFLMARGRKEAVGCQAAQRPLVQPRFGRRHTLSLQEWEALGSSGKTWRKKI